MKKEFIIIMLSVVIMISLTACSKVINSDDASTAADIEENVAEQVFTDEKPINSDDVSTTADIEEDDTEQGIADENLIENQTLSDCEIVNGLARTPTHYYAVKLDSLIRAPLDNIALQTEIPLPGSYDNIRLTGAKICGITKEWLFVNRWEYRENDSYDNEENKNRTVVTFRIAIESWEAEVISVIIDETQQLRPLPWYNFASDSLLIPGVTEDTMTIKAIPLSTMERVPVVLDGKPDSWSCWWLNTADDQAVFVECRNDDFSDSNFYLFDGRNHTKLVSYDSLNYKNQRWQELEDSTIGNLFREIINPEKAVLYEGNGEELNWYEICLLDKDGNVVDILFEYLEDGEGNGGYGMSAYDDKLMVTQYGIYGPAEFQFLCDPDTGAMFPTQN